MEARRTTPLASSTESKLAGISISTLKEQSFIRGFLSPGGVLSPPAAHETPIELNILWNSSDESTGKLLTELHPNLQRLIFIDSNEWFPPAGFEFRSYPNLTKFSFSLSGGLQDVHDLEEKLLRFLRCCRNLETACFNYCGNLESQQLGPKQDTEDTACELITLASLKSFTQKSSQCDERIAPKGLLSRLNLPSTCNIELEDFHIHLKRSWVVSFPVLSHQFLHIKAVEITVHAGFGDLVQVAATFSNASSNHKISLTKRVTLDDSHGIVKEIMNFITNNGMDPSIKTLHFKVHLAGTEVPVGILEQVYCIVVKGEHALPQAEASMLVTRFPSRRLGEAETI